MQRAGVRIDLNNLHEMHNWLVQNGAETMNVIVLKDPVSKKKYTDAVQLKIQK